MLSLLKSFFTHIVDFIYPRICNHCQSTIDTSHKIFCSACLQSLSLVNKQGRCSRCLVYLEDDFSIYCETCALKPHYFTELAATFEYQGLAKTLWREIQSPGGEEWIETAASFMVMQMIQLGYPIPDLVIPVPVNKKGLLFSKKSIKQLLAEKIATNLGCKYVDPLYAVSYFSQKGKNRLERMQLSSDMFTWRKRVSFCGKKILIVDDMMVSAATMHAVADKVQEGLPMQIYGISFCVQI